MCIAFSAIFYRYSGASPSTATVFRCLFGLPILAAVAFFERRRYGALPGATVRLAAIAGVLFAGDLIAWHHAIEAVGAGLATVLGNLQVLVVGLVAWAAFGERPPRSTLAAVPIVLVGIALISGLGGSAYGADPVRGVLLGLLTAFFYAGYLILIRRGGQDLRRPAGPVAVATASTVAAGVVIGLFMSDLDPRPGPASLGWLALLGVTAQSAGYLLISLSLPRLPAVMTSILLLTQPVATLGLSMLLLEEAPSARQLAGVALVIGGIAAATLGGRRSAGSAGRSTGTG
jgi:drug/metabolite transporter (DMT)-like permease